MNDSDAHDTTTPLEYLAHGLLGYIIGVVLYGLYLLLAHGQSVEVRTGLTMVPMVWGSDINDVVVWGRLLPIGCALAGLAQAWWKPRAALRDPETQGMLILGAFFLSLVGYLILATMPFSHPITEFYRAPHP